VFGLRESRKQIRGRLILVAVAKPCDLDPRRHRPIYTPGADALISLLISRQRRQFALLDLFEIAEPALRLVCLNLMAKVQGSLILALTSL